MKQIFLTLTLIVLFAGSVNARSLTAVANGNWNAASTWSPAFVPGNNDIIYIPGGKTVTISANENNKTDKMEVRVAGILKFSGGGAKLWINNQSVIFVYPAGKITANQNSNEITLGTTTVMNSSNNGITITGPSVARAGNSTNNLSASNAPTGFQAYSPGALPVQFVAFTATRQGNDVLVQWSTATEESADRFEVEISTDGRSFTKVATVSAAGNSTTLRQYSFTARNFTGNLQVRVKQVDFDGSFMYTAVRSLRAGMEASSIKMTVASGCLVLNFTSEVKDATVRVMSLAGQVLQEQKISAALGQVIVPTTQKGVSIVAVFTDSEIVATQKVVL